MAAAVRVLLRRGVQRTQVSHVVREARVSRGTFYRHFDSKRHMLGSAARELLDRMLPQVTAPGAVATRQELEAALRAMHDHVLSAALRERETARLVLIGGAASEPEAARWIAAHEDAWRRIVEKLLLRARGAKLLRDGVDVPLATSMILGSVQNVLRAAVRNGKADAGALAASLARLHADALAP
jgi:AcrR family transcriptional regulator